jgi:hypothetical protein
LTSKHTGALSAITLPASGRLLVGHVSASARDNPDVPIPAREYGPGGFFADARCRSCPAESELSHQGAEALTLVIHRNGCPELAAIRAELTRAAR